MAAGGVWLTVWLFLTVVSCRLVPEAQAVTVKELCKDNIITFNSSSTTVTVYSPNYPVDYTSDIFDISKECEISLLVSSSVVRPCVVLTEQAGLNACTVPYAVLTADYKTPTGQSIHCDQQSASKTLSIYTPVTTGDNIISLQLPKGSGTAFLVHISVIPATTTASTTTSPMSSVTSTIVTVTTNSTSSTAATRKTLSISFATTSSSNDCTTGKSSAATTENETSTNLIDNEFYRLLNTTTITTIANEFYLLTRVQVVIIGLAGGLALTIILLLTVALVKTRIRPVLMTTSEAAPRGEVNKSTELTQVVPIYESARTRCNNKEDASHVYSDLDIPKPMASTDATPYLQVIPAKPTLSASDKENASHVYSDLDLPKPMASFDASPYMQVTPAKPTLSASGDEEVEAHVYEKLQRPKN